MSWTRTYHVALRLLPPALRGKHGPAMEGLYARELERARGLGRLPHALAGAAGVWDVIRRGAYERVRPVHAAGAHRDHARETEHGLDAPGPLPTSPHPGGPLVLQPTVPALLRRHAVSFVLAFAALTTALLALYASRLDGVARASTVELIVLAVPFTAAMTIPMAVFVAVLREFGRLGADGTLASARRERDGLRRLVVPVLGAAAVVGALSFVVTAEIVPRANARLSVARSGQAAPKSDREMTIPELREAARRVAGEPDGRAHVASYEVEVQKKLALPAACVVLALAAIAIALRAPRGGAPLVVGASVALLGGYYVLLVTGETLASQLVVSPVIGMWGANALLVTAALVAMRRGRPPASPVGGPVAARG